jgi:hypothetical protein
MGSTACMPGTKENKKKEVKDETGMAYLPP